MEQKKHIYFLKKSQNSIMVHIPIWIFKIHAQGVFPFSKQTLSTSMDCSVATSHLTLCDPMDYCMPGSTVLRSLLEFAQTHVRFGRWCYLVISSSTALFSFSLQSFPASGSLPMSQLFTSGGQSTRTLASASVLSMNIQGWFPLGLTGLICLYGQIKAKYINQTW